MRPEVVAHGALCLALDEAIGRLTARRVELAADPEPWLCHPDYPDRVIATVDAAALTVRLAAAEYRRVLLQGGGR